MSPQILAVSGSLRTASFNSGLLRAAGEYAGRATFLFADIGALPHYRADLDGDPKPEPVAQLISQVQAADGLLIATPEYNYSIPGVLKNAIDWVSRPAYRSPLAKKTDRNPGSGDQPGRDRARSITSAANSRRHRDPGLSPPRFPGRECSREV